MLGNQNYKFETIATADDYEDADGDRILTFFQAQDRARQRGGQLAYAGPFRVRDAVKSFINLFRAIRTTSYDGRIRFEKHVLPVLGDVLVEQLTEKTDTGMAPCPRPVDAVDHRWNPKDRLR